MTLPGVCDMLQDDLVISRENLIQAINENAFVYLLPILRDIKLCRHFGHEQQWYRAFYEAKHNDMLNCLPFISHKHGFNKIIEADAMSIDDQQSSVHKRKANEEESSVDLDENLESKKRKRTTQKKRVNKTKTNEASEVSKETVHKLRKRKARENDDDDDIQEIINEVKIIQKKTITQNTLEVSVNTCYA